MKNCNLKLLGLLLNSASSTQTTVNEVFLPSAVDIARNVVKSKIIQQIPGFLKNSQADSYLGKLFSKLDVMNSAILANTADDRIINISKLPFYSFIFDFRVLITIMGIACVIMLPYSDKYNKDLSVTRFTKIKSVLMPIFLALVSIKFIVSIVCLLVNPLTYFTFSSLLFGANIWVMLLLVIDIITFLIVYQYTRRNGLKVYKNPADLIQSIIDKFTGKKGENSKFALVDLFLVLIFFKLASYVLMIFSRVTSKIVSMSPTTIGTVISYLDYNVINPFFYLIFNSTWFESLNWIINLPNNSLVIILDLAGVPENFIRSVISFLVKNFASPFWYTLLGWIAYKIIYKIMDMYNKRLFVKLNETRERNFILKNNYTNRIPISSRYSKNCI